MEDYRWTTYAAVGIALIVFGNVLVLSKRK